MDETYRLYKEALRAKPGRAKPRTGLGRGGRPERTLRTRKPIAEPTRPAEPGKEIPALEVPPPVAAVPAAAASVAAPTAATLGGKVPPAAELKAFRKELAQGIVPTAWKFRGKYKYDKNIIAREIAKARAARSARVWKVRKKLFVREMGKIRGAFNTAYVGGLARAIGAKYAITNHKALTGIAVASTIGALVYIFSGSPPTATTPPVAEAITTTVSKLGKPDPLANKMTSQAETLRKTLSAMIESGQFETENKYFVSYITMLDKIIHVSKILSTTKPAADDPAQMQAYATGIQQTEELLAKSAPHLEALGTFFMQRGMNEEAAQAESLLDSVFSAILAVDEARGATV